MHEYVCAVNTRYSAMTPCSGSGAGGHVGGEDVVGVAVEVLAGPVIAHRGAGVGVPGGDLDTETAVLLFEPSAVINTGDAGGELTAEVEELS